MQVLVLGWQPKSIRALQRHGGEVTCVIAPGADRAAPAWAPRRVSVPDPSNVESVASGLAREGLDSARFDVVCSQNEFYLAAASALGGGDRSHLPLATVIGLRDKAVQKAAVRQAGVPVAGFDVIIDPDDLEAVAVPHRVVKPLASSSSRSVFVIDGPAAAKAAVGEIRRRRIAGPWLVEDFVDGAELQIDGVVRDGKIAFFAVSRYLQNLIKVKAGGVNASIVLDRDREGDLYSRAGRLARSALKSLGHGDGVFHLEAFETPGGLVFGECAGRVSGGRTDELVVRKFGVDLHDEWARSVLGEDSAVSLEQSTLPERSRPQSPETFGDVYLTAPPGRLLSLPAEDEIRARPGVADVYILARLGEETPEEIEASSTCAAQAVVCGKDEGEVKGRLLDLAWWFRASTSTDKDPTAPRILILGGKSEVVRKAAVLGLEVVNIQKPTAFDPAALEHAAQVHLVDYQDVATVEAVVESLHRVAPFSRVFTQNEAAQVVAGHLTSKLGLPGNGIEVTRTLHDKRALRALLNEQGIGPVAVQEGNTKAALQAFVARHGAAVVKPAMGSGSLGVRKVFSQEDIEGVWSSLRSSCVEEFFAEELLSGTELSVETFSVQGRHMVLAVTGKDTGGGVVELGHVIPAPLSAVDTAQVGDFTRRVLDAVGLVDGLAHTEVMLTANGPRVIESHCRRGGDRINELVELVYGVDMETLAYRLALPAEQLPETPVACGGAAIRFLVAGPGRVLEVGGVDSAAALEGVVEVQVKVGQGDIVNPLRWSEDRCGHILVQACDGPTAVRIAKEAASRIRIRTAPLSAAPDNTLAALLAEVDEVLDPFAARYAFPSHA